MIGRAVETNNSIVSLKFLCLNILNKIKEKYETYSVRIGKQIYWLNNENKLILVKDLRKYQTTVNKIASLLNVDCLGSNSYEFNYIRYFVHVFQTFSSLI